MSQPKLIATPWGVNGLKNDIPEQRSGSMTAEAATYNDGFPSITMTPVSTGGKPPSGKDMNGILYELSSHICYQNQGGFYTFDSGYAKKINGYPKGAILINDQQTKLYISLVSSNKTNFNTAEYTGKWAVVASVPVNNLTSLDTEAPLSAAQGKALKEAINGITGTGVQELVGVTDLNAITGNAFFKLTGSEANKPDAMGAADGVGWQVSSSGQTTQWLCFLGSDVYVRSKDNGRDWSAWQKQLIDADVINNLMSGNVDKPLSAAQGKVLKGLIDNKTTLKTIDYYDNHQGGHIESGFYRANEKVLNGKRLPPMDIHINHPSYSGLAYARGIGFSYGGSWSVYTTSYSSSGEYLGTKEILTELHRSNDVNSKSETNVATSKAVKTAYDKAVDVGTALAATGLSDLLVVTDLNAITGNAFFKLTGSEANKPDAMGAADGVGWQVSSSGQTTQFICNRNARLYMRTNDDGRTWSNWEKLISDSDLKTIRVSKSKSITSTSARKSVGVTGEVVTYPDGRVVQTFLLDSTRVDDWNPEPVGSGDRGPYLSLDLWTAMPNKVFTARAQTLRKSGAGVATYWAEGGEWLVGWDIGAQGTNKSRVNFAFNRIDGNGGEEVSIFIEIEGY